MIHKTIFSTDRGVWHQQKALESAPKNLEISMLRNPDKQTLINALQDAEFLISERSGRIDKEVIQNAPQLRLIQRLGTMVYDIDLKAAADAGVMVCSQPVGGVIRVAEHLVMQILVLAKKIQEAQKIALEASPQWGQSYRTDEDTFAYNWSGRTDIGQIWRRTIGIIGFGEIGIEFARRMRGWDCTILYNKRTRLPAQVEDDLKVAYVSSETLYAKSDFLVNLLPFFPGTDMLLNVSVFLQMKTSAFLVSCGSGSTIDEAALAEAIRLKKLAGAALDTFEYEPIQAENPLIRAARDGYNILLTPHIAAGSADQQDHRHDRASDYSNILRYINGEPLEHRVE
jgi:phosphoglycerate dehydrogenase-like enzyme